MIHFFCPGNPQPQGSTRSFVRGGKVVTTSANANLRPWRLAVAWAAREAMAELQVPPGSPVIILPLTGGVIVSAVFVFSRPQTVTARQRPNHTVRPDIDKLTRSLLDSLADSGLLQDDAQVVRIMAEKRYIGPGYESPGVHVAVVQAWCEKETRK